MRPTRRSLQLVLCIATAWFVWSVFARSAQETVTLHVSDVRNEDHFARVWVVEDRPFLWIRAEGPDRRWLGPLTQKQQVTLTRAGRRSHYAASVREDAEARSYVDALFREKYGTADLARDVIFDRQTIPIRLTPL